MVQNPVGIWINFAVGVETEPRMLMKLGLKRGSDEDWVGTASFDCGLFPPLRMPDLDARGGDCFPSLCSGHACDRERRLAMIVGDGIKSERGLLKSTFCQHM